MFTTRQVATGIFFRHAIVNSRHTLEKIDTVF